MNNLEEGAILVIDTETNALWNPNEIHVICTRTWNDEVREFVQPLRNEHVKKEFYDYIRNFKTFVGHNFIQYDLLRVLNKLLPDHNIRVESVLDTLVISRLLNYSIVGGHSIKAWGDRFGIEKIGTGIEQWDTLTDEMIQRCHSDTKINLGVLKKYWKYIQSESWKPSMVLEHQIAEICGIMTLNGFAFDYEKAYRLKQSILDLLDPIDKQIAEAFPPKPTLVREITPRITKTGAFNLNDFRWYEGDDLTIFNGGPFSLVKFEEFNAGSPKQMVERLNEAGWKPTEKTKGHIEALKNKKTVPEKLAEYKKYGWRICEDNLKTLPDEAPEAAKNLGKRVILQSRLSDLDEWIALAQVEGNQHIVHGEFSPIGAWTHRLSHSKPNLANVPVAKRSDRDTEFETLINDFNDDMRSLWVARPGYRLIGTDADGLQMRIFAHYVNDSELINALIEGKKEEKTDIHSVHQRKLGDPCKSRDAAKTFIYAWLLGAGNSKVAEILECSTALAKGAVQNFISSYPGLKTIKETQIPEDAARGYFIGLDGRKVICDSEHLMLAGYLQNGEAIIMKGACVEWQSRLKKEGIEFRMVTWPHDEWQTEIPDDQDLAKYVTDIQIQAIRNQAIKLNMNCPLEGTTSIQKDGFIGGYNWQMTH